MPVYTQGNATKVAIRPDSVKLVTVVEVAAVVDPKTGMEVTPASTDSKITFKDGTTATVKEEFDVVAADLT